MSAGVQQDALSESGVLGRDLQGKRKTTLRARSEMAKDIRYLPCL